MTWRRLFWSFNQKLPLTSKVSYKSQCFPPCLLGIIHPAPCWNAYVCPLTWWVGPSGACLVSWGTRPSRIKSQGHVGVKLTRNSPKKWANQMQSQSPNIKPVTGNKQGMSEECSQEPKESYKHGTGNQGQESQLGKAEKRTYIFFRTPKMFRELGCETSMRIVAYWSPWKERSSH